MKSKLKKISIIGGAGFVGTNFANRLAKKKIPFEIIDIKVSQKFKGKSLYGDVRDVDSLRKAISGSLVINLAAVHRDDIANSREYYNTNVKGAENVCKVCSEKKIKKILFTSSVAIYGFALPNTDENGVINPFNDYGKSKFEAEKKYILWSKAKENSLIIVRSTVIFGEGNRGNVYNLIKQIKSGRFVMIGNGLNKKSIAYIENVCAFLEECMNMKSGLKIFNYADQPAIEMNTFVKQIKINLDKNGKIGVRLPYWIGLYIGYLGDIINRLLGVKVPITSVRIKKFCIDTTFSSTKEELKNFRPPYTVNQSIRRTIKNEFITPDPNRPIFYTE